MLLMTLPGAKTLSSFPHWTSLDLISEMRYTVVDFFFLSCLREGVARRRPELRTHCFSGFVV